MNSVPHIGRQYVVFGIESTVCNVLSVCSVHSLVCCSNIECALHIVQFAMCSSSVVLLKESG